MLGSGEGEERGGDTGGKSGKIITLSEIPNSNNIMQRTPPDRDMLADRWDKVMTRPAETGK